MKLHIYTQDQENYGAHDWDGVGECPQYWKFKGGQDFFVPMGSRINSETATAIVMAVRGDIEENSEYFRSDIIGWDIVADDFMTESDIREQYMNSFTARLSGLEMVVMSILSDAQELLAMGATNDSRQYMNRAKFILSEMMETKQTA